MKKSLKIIKYIFLAFTIIIFLAVLAVFVLPLAATRNMAGNEYSMSWMSPIPDDKPISDIVIPGTHDSAANFVELPLFTRCQADDIAAQLNIGCRYLDIRLAVSNHSDDPLMLMHSFANCKSGPMPWTEKLYFSYVLETVYLFLKNNPSEIVILNVKHEYGDESDRIFQELLHKYISGNADMWYLSDEIPVLGDVRGKIILLRRYEDECGFGAASGIASIWPDQGGSGDSKNYELSRENNYPLYVQDRYEYSSSEKREAFFAGFEIPVMPGSVFINFMSTKGTMPVGCPYYFAAVLNKDIRTTQLRPQGGMWIVIDFADEETVNSIINMNFKKITAKHKGLAVIFM